MNYTTENLNALVRGDVELTPYQKVLAQQEYKLILDHIKKLEDDSFRFMPL